MSINKIPHSFNYYFIVVSNDYQELGPWPGYTTRPKGIEMMSVYSAYRGLAHNRMKVRDFYNRSFLSRKEID